MLALFRDLCIQSLQPFEQTVALIIKMLHTIKTLHMYYMLDIAVKRGPARCGHQCIGKLILEVSWQKWINASHAPEEIAHSG